LGCTGTVTLALGCPIGSGVVPDGGLEQPTTVRASEAARTDRQENLELRMRTPLKGLDTLDTHLVGESE
jgi:hypothetical protein